MSNHIPTKGWTWPAAASCLGHINGIACTKGAGHSGPCTVGGQTTNEMAYTAVGMIQFKSATPTEGEFQGAEFFVPVSMKDLDQLRKDRDELLATLEGFLPLWRVELENEGPGQVPLLLEQVERAEALIQRVRANGAGVLRGQD